MSAESHAKCFFFFKPSTLPGGFIKNSSSISNLNLNLHHPLLTHAHFKNRIRSHENPENLDSTRSKHVPTPPKTLSISRLRLTNNVSLAKTDRLKCETTYRIRSVAKCRGSWVVGRGRGSWVWVWVWVNVVGKNKPPKKIKN